MAPPTVLIIGCGVSGPVLSLLLKKKGYKPVIYEKVRVLGEAGASLMLNPNGMKVLNLLTSPNKLFGDVKALPLANLWHGTGSGETLVHNSLPSNYAARYGQSSMGIKRTTLNISLKEMALDAGIEVHEGFELVDIEEGEASVTAHFGNGQSVTGSFLVGCDGIKAASRRILLQNSGTKEGPPIFTGLTQTAGISMTPSALLEKPATMSNWYGNAVHLIAYPVSTTHISWAVTLSQTEERPEAWKLATRVELEAKKQDLEARLKGFEPALLEMVRTAERIISFGLFDRAELSGDEWFSSRCVLIGDAAHPTSPHLGQGANQALEDCYHLSRLLPQLNGDSDGNLAALSPIFEEFARLRQPRTSALVKGARKKGEERVVTGGPELCRARDAQLVVALGDAEEIQRGNDQLYREPF
ncbi:FAD/NAD(P)-binding domain-containing protein [Penicillium malachiteum]|uniref:FAD/NAD(P)-binding domain-containing protein n=1 Tax=Penicillium malachiteum TaxID=1324776 RepID=UPI00254669C3|nr:FAD/NAD(P)-binding domain-containing protein [Penicillium malachiteum]KAJ5726117.1 FAD/NAD(P)-binding domain-containing protein [Penicillium malachiteum]